METIINDLATYMTSQTKRLRGVEYDESGTPAGYSTEEVFDELDKKLIEYFGETYRELANKRRACWNEKSSWKFEQL
jgi:hypothetical protein